MTQQRTNYIVRYIAGDGYHRSRTLQTEKDARAYADQVRAHRIERISVEILWDRDDVTSDRPEFDLIDHGRH